jgi:hypothetical protein
VSALKFDLKSHDSNVVANVGLLAGAKEKWHMSAC